MYKIKGFFSNSKENATDDTPLFIKYVNVHDLYIPYWMMYAHTHTTQSVPLCTSVTCFLEELHAQALFSTLVRGDKAGAGEKYRKKDCGIM